MCSGDAVAAPAGLSAVSDRPTSRVATPVTIRRVSRISRLSRVGRVKGLVVAIARSPPSMRGTELPGGYPETALSVAADVSVREGQTSPESVDGAAEEHL